MILTVYFHGPMTNWASLGADTIYVAPGEVVATHALPWLWLCRFKAKAILRDLNTARCGYVIQDGDTVLEHVPATDQELVP